MLSEMDTTGSPTKRLLVALLVCERRAREVCFLGILEICVFSAAALAQAKPTPGSVKVTTRLVVINVVVHNKDGQPVNDLRQRDFTIVDNGKPQQVSIFSLDHYRTPHSPPESRDSSIFSNLVATEGHKPTTAVVILLDGVETGFADSVFARTQIIKFLRQIPAGVHVGLYVLGKRLSVIQDFTGNASPLLEALRSDRSESEMLSHES